MSYSGTVRCSYCYVRGHNKATCEKLKANMERRRKENPEDPYAAYYFKKNTEKRIRRCSYCEDIGHNRATCAQLKLARSKTIEYASTWRHKAKEYFMNVGLGIGALVMKRDWNDRTTLCMVTRIDWEDYDHRFKHCAYHRAYPVFTVPVRELGADSRPHERTTSVQFCDSSADILYPGDEKTVWDAEIVSPITSEAVEQQLTEEWLSGKGSAKKLFDKETKPYNVSTWVEKESFDSAAE